MIDTDKWIESARISLDELEKEVKRLRDTIDYIRDVGRMNREQEPSGHLLSIMEKVLTTEEYLEWRNEE
jgi:hypothetical protein